jgi:hypothetical protein
VEELQAAAADTHHQALKDLTYLGHGLGVTGARDEGRKVLAEMQALSRSRYTPPITSPWCTKALEIGSGNCSGTKRGSMNDP